MSRLVTESASLWATEKRGTQNMVLRLLEHHVNSIAAIGRNLSYRHSLRGIGSVDKIERYFELACTWESVV